jgi:mannose-6-phosphate isomerase-like protein (cupin superfamily)
MSATSSAPVSSVYEPTLFEHHLDPALFTSERLDELCRLAAERGSLKVQFADPGRQRYGNDPVYTTASYPIVEDAMRRPVQYRITGVDRFAGPEYRACLDHMFEVAGVDPALGRWFPETVVRVFSPGAVVAIHGDPDLKLVSTISGETIWWVRPPESMTTEEHERLLRGNFFLDWEEDEDRALRIPPGHSCFVPSRWPHWLTHPGDVPVVSFEIGFWTTESIRLRKIYDVNWLLRRVGRDPAPPGGEHDGLKCRVFDAVSTLTRRGTQYRGI